MKTKRTHLNRKGMAPLMIILLIVVLFFLAYSFNLFGTASIISPGTVRSTSSSFISSNDKGATYSFSFTSDGQQDSHSTAWTPGGDYEFFIDNQFRTYGELPAWVPNLIQDKYFEASQVKILDLTAVKDTNTASPQTCQVVFEENKAKCKIVSANNEKKAVVSCIFYGKTVPIFQGEKTSAIFLGPSGGSAVVTIPTIGNEPKVEMPATDTYPPVEEVPTSLPSASPVNEDLPATDNPETPVVECTANIDCTDICKSKTPTCISGQCRCDDVIKKVPVETSGTSLVLPSFIQSFVDFISNIFNKIFGGSS